MELYQFVKQMYENSDLKEEIIFDRFIKGFMSGTLNTNSVKEAFWFEDDFLGTYRIDYEVDHEKQEIKLIFKEE